MDMTFNSVVDILQNLTLDEKEDIKFIIEREIIEERRKQIYKDYLTSKKEYVKRKIKFSNKLDDLKRMVE